jgi:HK97 family phage portal protein
MGLLAQTVTAITSCIPERKVAVGAAINTWESGTPQQQKDSYYRYALDGYTANEVAFACIEERCTTLAEPRLVAVRKTDKGPEQLHDHPVLELFERPNPFMSGEALISALGMFRDIGGSGYLEKVRSGAGKVVELWPLRPDRMWVIPDADPNVHIRGWKYTIGADDYYLAARDVIQWKSRHPLDDWYGLPLLRPAAVRIDTAAAMRTFTQAFFNNAGIPAGLLALEKTVTPAEAQMIRDRARNDYGGRNAFNMMVLGGQGQVTYTPMGMPLGERGLVMPELDEILDAKIAMPTGVPLELIGARLGMIHGNRTTMKEARAGFIDETMVTIWRELAAVLTMALQPEYGDFDYLEFDLSTVKALQEDENAKSERVIRQLHAGAISVQEARIDLGREPEFESGAILVMPDNISGLPADQLDAPPEPAPMALGAGSGPGTNGSLTAREREVLGA